MIWKHPNTWEQMLSVTFKFSVVGLDEGFLKFK